jgi:hypothetical protein
MATLRLDSLPDETISREAFDQRTQHRWRDESLEVFACSRCSTILLGVCDCHLAFPNPDNLQVTVSYNRPQSFRCPNCSALLASPSDTVAVTVTELADSGWSWLIHRPIPNDRNA